MALRGQGTWPVTNLDGEVILNCLGRPGGLLGGRWEELEAQMWGRSTNWRDVLGRWRQGRGLRGGSPGSSGRSPPALPAHRPRPAGPIPRCWPPPPGTRHSCCESRRPRWFVPAAAAAAVAEWDRADKGEKAHPGPGSRTGEGPGCRPDRGRSCPQGRGAGETRRCRCLAQPQSWDLLLEPTAGCGKGSRATWSVSKGALAAVGSEGTRGRGAT